MRRPLAPLQLFLAAILAVTAAMPDWITIWAGHRDIYAGLWGTSMARWDDMRVDLDVFGVAYVAFAITIVGIVMLVRAAFSDKPAVIAMARKAMIATAIAMVLFVLRMLLETGVGLYWAGVVGPLAAFGAIATLRK